MIDQPAYVDSDSTGTRIRRNGKWFVWQGYELVEETDDSLKFDLEQAREAKKAGVPVPTEVTRAHSRLAILPTPNQSDLSEAGTYIESPWPVTDLPAVDPNLDWDTAVTETVALSELTGTNRYLKRAKVTEHIETINKAASPLKSYALVAELDGSMIIIDGHHRLMAAWLLGQETAPVWKVEL